MQTSKSRWYSDSCSRGLKLGTEIWGGGDVNGRRALVDLQAVGWMSPLRDRGEMLRIES